MTEQNFSIWQKRWDALDNNITQYLASFGDDLTPQMRALKCLVERLQIFSKDQFNFFYTGFSGGSTPLLEKSFEFPPGYVLRITRDQIASDLEAIRRVVDQRRSQAESQEGGLAAQELSPLEKADRLAWLAVQPMIKAGKMDGNITVITYFHKSTEIRLIPYAPVMLVGTLSVTDEIQRDYLVLPHEVGHYVYRHGFIGKENVRSIPRTLDRILTDGGCPEWMLNWQEEIFADIYGCLIAGPAMALASQDLALNFSVTPLSKTAGRYYIYGEFTKDDGMHPVPALRPYIYTTVLEHMGLQPLAEKLKTRWDNILKERGTETFTLRYREDIKIDIRKDAYQMVRSAVKAVFDNELLPNPRRSEDWKRWSNEPGGTWEDFEVLYQDFESKLDGLLNDVKVPDWLELLALPKEPLAPQDKLPQFGRIWKEWIKKEKFFPGFPDDAIMPLPPTEIAAGRAGNLRDLQQEPRYTWMHVLHASGWAIKLGNHHGGVTPPERSASDQQPAEV